MTTNNHCKKPGLPSRMVEELTKPVTTGCTTSENSKAITSCHKKTIEPHATVFIPPLSIKAQQSIFGLMSPVGRVRVIRVEILP